MGRSCESYRYVHVENVVSQDGARITPTETTYEFTTPQPRKTGVLIVGLGGNNGSTFFASQIANQKQLSWQTKYGEQESNYLGTLSQASVIPVGRSHAGVQYKAFQEIIDLVPVEEIVVHGWDLCHDNMQQCVKKAQVLPYHLQSQLHPYTKDVVPMRSVYYKDFIAANQEGRAKNILPGNHACNAHLSSLRNDIRQFKQREKLEHVIVLWSANTERFMKLEKGVHDTDHNLLKAIREEHPEISPSLMFGVAAVLEGCTFLNGAPQNTLVPGLLQLAENNNTFVGGNDFKSGQTKFKSMMVDFLISSGFRLDSLVSYNHLGNNDGKNLSSQAQFESKKISKSTVIDDMIHSNRILFPDGAKPPDHKVVIEYVPGVGDDKRAMDEYVSEIFMGGKQIISTYNICPDSLLAVPIMFDLVLFSEWLTRLRFKKSDGADASLPPVLSHLSFFFKAPAVNDGEAPINAFSLQRNSLAQLALASKGLHCFNPMSRL